MARKTRLLSLVLIIVITISTIGYEYYVPELAGRRYLKKLQLENDILHVTLTKFTSIADTVLDNRGPFANKDQALAQLLLDINRTEMQLNIYLRESQQLPALPLNGYFGTYKKTKVLKKQAARVVSQSKDVLSRYKEYIAYARSLSQIQIAYENQIKALQSVTFLDTVDRTRLAQDITLLKKTLSDLTALTAPEEFKASKEQLASVISKTINGYETFNSGLQSQSESLIDEGIFAIDTQSALYYSEVEHQMLDALIALPVQNEVNGLAAKTSQLLAIPHPQ